MNLTQEAVREGQAFIADLVVGEPRSAKRRALGRMQPPVSDQGEDDAGE